MLGEYCDIQIAIYDEMKDEIYFIFNFWLICVNTLYDMCM